MTIREAIRARNSVRQYREQPLEPACAAALEEAIARINREAGLRFQLVLNEPKAFSSFLAHYGRFRGVSNYFALVGPDGPELDEKCGYYGEELVLLAQTLGLNTCWVQLTYKKIPGAFEVGPGERLTVVIAVGYGQNQGVPHRNKAVEKLYRADGEIPDWFRAGMESALLAPTAVNQQRFLLTLSGREVRAEALRGPCTKIDLGIVKYHFEQGAGRENFEWI